MAVVSGTYNYYLAPYLENVFGEWVLPIGIVDGIDLRTIPDQGIQGEKPRGFAFAAHDKAAPVPAGSILLGSDLNSQPIDQLAIEQALGLLSGDLAGVTILEGVVAILTDYSDPTGDNHVRPLIPTTGNLEIHLGGHSVIYRERFKWGEHTHTAKVQAVLQANFARMKAKDDGRNTHLKLLGSWERKYGVTEIVPGETSMQPETTITESFNTADSDTLGPDNTWTEQNGDWDIISNRAQSLTNADKSEAYVSDQDLSSDDMEAQVDWIASTVSTFQDYRAGTMVRYEGGAGNPDHYLGAFAIDASAGNGTPRVGFFQMWKAVLGVATQLGADLSDTTEPSSTLRMRSDGSTHELWRDGVSQGTRTDTALTGDVKTGIESFDDAFIFDNFLATDDLAAAQSIVPILMRRYAS